MLFYVSTLKYMIIPPDFRRKKYTIIYAMSLPYSCVIFEVIKFREFNNITLKRGTLLSTTPRGPRVCSACNLLRFGGLKFTI